MRQFIRLSTLGAAILTAVASSAPAQNQYIGFAYPAGGQQGTTFPIRLGGQGLLYASDLVVTGEGVSVRLVDYFRVVDNQEQGLVRQQLNLLKKKETVIDDALAAKMLWFELSAPIGPNTGPDAATSLICHVCGDANPLDATICGKCNAKLRKPTDAKAGETPSGEEAPMSEKELAKQRLIERLERMFAEDERDPAVRSQTELVFAEVTIAPDAKPGRREIRVITKRGISNPLPFYVDQVPEVARKPMKTMKLPVLGREHLAQRNRPAEEEELRVTIPCTVNGQIAAGEVNRYRFQASKGQRLVMSARARDLIPYVPDGVPGWFQAVLKLCDANGNEVAYNDDFRSNPDPLIYYEVPADGEYVLSINEALYRGRESFTYRITVAETPRVTSIFPLGARVGEPVTIEMDGWNLEHSSIAPPKEDKPGRYLITATNGKYASNCVPFALDDLPEAMDQEPNDEPAKAQKVTLPIIINGRMDHQGDWDVFEIEGKAGETIVAEVTARRLGSPIDSFIKVTGPDGKIIAINDDHFDAGSGMNTDHADSYVMVKLPADGKYHVHLGDTPRRAGKEYAYRLRISHPRPDFELRSIPSKLVIRSTASAAATVYVMRKDGYDGPITVGFKDLPPGFESGGATIPAGKEVVSLGLKTTLAETEQPLQLTIVGTAKIGETEIVREAVPCDDQMQAFLWRHLMPVEDLPVVVFNPGWQPPAERVRIPIRDEDRPADLPRNVTRASADWYRRQIERLYQEWLLTDEFANDRIADIEGRLIQ
ncbi:MAG: PPC domain-containing protein [Patescibacteria group bacterium]|nr:PPC domain-containing protein [Patescibacteria group bacterium]